jgi:uncharacterized protein YkwD
VDYFGRKTMFLRIVLGAVFAACLGILPAPDISLGQQSGKPSGKHVKELKTSESEILKRTNEVRKQNNLPEFESSPALQYLAANHTRNMCDSQKLSHESDSFPEGWRKFNERLDKIKVKMGAENVALRTLESDPKWSKEVVSNWMKSPGHKKNILNPEFKFIGIGAAACGKDLGYATQVFSNKEGRVP